MNKMKGIGNKIIQISEVQDSRFWVHSFELGFGKWITNKELLDLIESKRMYKKRIGCGKILDNYYGSALASEDKLYLNCGDVDECGKHLCEECREHDKCEKVNESGHGQEVKDAN